MKRVVLLGWARASAGEEEEGKRETRSLNAGLPVEKGDRDVPKWQYDDDDGCSAPDDKEPLSCYHIRHPAE